MLASFHDIDDDGTKLVGTVHNDAWLQALLAIIDARWSEATTTLTGNQDNFDYSEADYLRCNNATTITLRGLKAPATPAKPGKPLVIFAIGAGTVVLNDQDVNSTAANRLITGTSAAVTIAAVTGWAVVQYDATTARWRVRGSSATLTVANGGTGATSLTGILLGNGTSPVTALADPLVPAHGGTGAATLTAHGVLVGEGTGTVAATAAGTAGQALRSGGAAADPAYGEIPQTTTSTGTVNDFALTAGCHYLRCNNATLLTLNGLAAGYDGQRVVIESVGAGQVDLAHQAAGSTAANRLINFATSANTSLAAGVGTAEIEYDATTARWRLIWHDQGAWITATYAAGNFTSSAGTWVVDSGDVTTLRYFLRDRTLWVIFVLSTTTITGAPGELRISNAAYGSFTVANPAYAPMAQIFNNAVASGGLIFATTSVTYLALTKYSGGAYVAETNLTYLYGQIALEVN